MSPQQPLRRAPQHITLGASLRRTPPSSHFAPQQVGSAATSKYALASRSLIGEGRQYIRALNEALLLLIEGCAKKPRPKNLDGTEEEAAAAEIFAGDETMESGKAKEAVAVTGTQGAEKLFRQGHELKK